jgi:hypothetical protein
MPFLPAGWPRFVADHAQRQFSNQLVFLFSSDDFDFTIAIVPPLLRR